MWQQHAIIALDLARDRAREAQAEAARHALARAARHAAGTRALTAPGATSRVRIALALPVRIFGDAADAVASAACTAATRIEGRST